MSRRASAHARRVGLPGAHEACTDLSGVQEKARRHFAWPHKECHAAGKRHLCPQHAGHLFSSRVRSTPQPASMPSHPGPETARSDAWEAAPLAIFNLPPPSFGVGRGEIRHPGVSASSRNAAHRAQLCHNPNASLAAPACGPLPRKCTTQLTPRYPPVLIWAETFGAGVSINGGTRSNKSPNCLAQSGWSVAGCRT